MAELVNGEKNGADSVMDFEIPEITQAMRTPEILECLKMLQTAQSVRKLKIKFY